MNVEKEIIDRVLDNTASEAEAREVAEWFATNEGQSYLSERLASESLRMGDKEINEWTEGDIPVEQMRKRFFNEVEQRKRKSMVWRIAAVLVPFLLLGATATFFADRAGAFSDTEYAEITVPCGERMQVVLQDGTSVELNSATTLRYPKQFGWFSRKVELDGEGYFKVTKDKSRPFSVKTKSLDIKVTGTQFNAKAYSVDHRICVTLDEGSVLLKDISSKEYPLSPGEKAVYDCRSGKCKITRPVDLEGVKAWRVNSLNFYMTPLKDIIKVMERQYDTRFIITDSALLDSKYTLSTSKVNVADVLHDLEKVSRIEFVAKGDDTFEIRQK